MEIGRMVIFYYLDLTLTTNTMPDYKMSEAERKELKRLLVEYGSKYQDASMPDIRSMEKGIQDLFESYTAKKVAERNKELANKASEYKRIASRILRVFKNISYLHADNFEGDRIKLEEYQAELKKMKEQIGYHD